MLDSLDTLIAFTLIMLVVSLLITIAVQMVSSALNLRGRNLARGLKETLKTVAPDIGTRADEFAEKILRGPAISDSSFKQDGMLEKCSSVLKWRVASAVRPDEVFDAIHRIALGRLGEDGNLRDYAQNLLTALGMNKNLFEVGNDRINKAKEIAKSITDAAKNGLSDDLKKEKLSAISKVTDDFIVYATGEAERIAQSSPAEDINHAYQKFEYWSNICQERAQQWFTMHARIATVIFAIFFAFWLQLDTVEIFKLVSTNHTIRDKLTAQAAAVASHAQKILSESKNVPEEALSVLIAKQKDADTIKALNSVKVEEFDTRESLRKKISDALTRTQGKGAKLVGDYDSAINDVASNRLDKQASDFREVRADLDKSGFDLLPMGDKWRWGERWSDEFGHHFFGMLFSVALLSLGAPFWYNILKNLTSLRSTVAQNMSDEQKQATKQTDFGALSKAPPTTAPPR